MQGKYSFIVRFDLSDERESRIADYLKTLIQEKRRSANSFVIDAISEYIDYQSYTREQHLEDIRRIIREEMRDKLISAYPNNGSPSANLAPPPKSAEELDRELTEDLDLFG